MATLIYTNEDLHRDLNKLILWNTRCDFHPTLILGISRGGLVPAVMLSRWYDVPLYPYEFSLRDHKRESILDIGRLNKENVLVVDDICDNGTSLKILKEVIDLSSGKPMFMTLVRSDKQSETLPDMWGTAINHSVHDWVEFPWEKWWK